MAKVLYLARVFALVAGAMAAALASAAHPAQAASFTMSVNTRTTDPPAQPHGVERILTYQQFDPALGTLDSIELTISGTAYMSSQIYGVFGWATGEAIGLGWLTLSLLGPGGVPLFHEQHDTGWIYCAGLYSCRARPPAGDIYLWHPASDPQTFLLADPAVLAPFVGTGSVDVSAALVVEAGIGYCDTFEPAPVTPFCTVSMTALWVGDAQIAYNYSSVWEPPSVAALGIGLACLGLGHRRRARNAGR